MLEINIPHTVVCARCGRQRGDHSGGSFLCPDSPARAGNRFRFTDREFFRADG